MRELEAAPATFRFVMTDVKKISVRVKGLNVLSIAEGTALTIQAHKDASPQGAGTRCRWKILAQR
jgi:hypothetical protein